jgi:fructokinase
VAEGRRAKEFIPSCLVEPVKVGSDPMKQGKVRIFGLGEVLWDLLPGGKQLGGAPANFAYHAHALGAEAWPVTRVGSDALGAEILERLNTLGLPTMCVQTDPGAPTGTVSVEILPGGRHRFTIHENVAWDRIEATEAALALAAKADAVCFGTLGQRCEESRSAIQAIAGAVASDALRIFDVNLRQRFYSRDVIEESLRIANVVKINDEELPVAAEMLGLHGDAVEQLEQLATRYELKLVALTRGSEGSLLYANGRASSIAGTPIAVVDTIGAGDAFTAAMALGWLAEWDLDEINRRAGAVASFVCSQPGATPPLPAEIVAPFGIRYCAVTHLLDRPQPPNSGTDWK